MFTVRRNMLFLLRLMQSVFWWEDRSVLCMARLLHIMVDTCVCLWFACLYLWCCNDRQWCHRV